MTPKEKESVLSYLEHRLERKVYDTWCRRLDFSEAGENLYQVGPVPNIFYRDWLERELRKPLEEAFEKTFGRVPTLVFKVVAEPDSLPLVPAPPPRVAPPVLAEAPRRAELDEPKTVSNVVLNPRYTFEKFVDGPSNRMAYAASVAVSESPGRAYNPLFIHGGVGLGKTHLLQAICHALLARNPYMKIFYLSCEMFVNDYVSAVQKRMLEAFRAKYRTADVLVVDDVHFLVAKEGSQEEFFHTFNALHIAQKQIILSSDQPAKDIPTLKEHLLSRFVAGLPVLIEPPTFETRLAILRARAESQGRDVPPEVLNYIASAIQTNIRELEGAITKVIGYAALSARPLTLDLAKEALKDSVILRSEHLTIGQIQSLVAPYFGRKVSELQARKWTKATSLARQVCIYLCKKFTHHSLAEIGSEFGGKDHTTVLYSIRKVETLSQSNATVRSDLERLSREIQARL